MFCVAGNGYLRASSSFGGADSIYRQNGCIKTLVNKAMNLYSSDLFQFYIIINYITKKISITIMIER